MVNVMVPAPQPLGLPGRPHPGIALGPPHGQYLRARCTVTFDITGAGTGELTVIVSEWNGRALLSPLSVPAVSIGPINTTTPSFGNVSPLDEAACL